MARLIRVPLEPICPARCRSSVMKSPPSPRWKPRLASWGPSTQTSAEETLLQLGSANLIYLLQDFFFHIYQYVRFVQPSISVGSTHSTLTLTLSLHLWSLPCPRRHRACTTPALPCPAAASSTAAARRVPAGPPLPCRCATRCGPARPPRRRRPLWSAGAVRPPLRRACLPARER